MGSHYFLIMQFNIVILACFLCSLVVAVEEKERAGGLLGFGLLGGNDNTTTATTTTSSDTTTTPSTTATTASSGDTTTTEDPSSGAIQGLIDLLLGISSTLPIEDIANLMGINTNPIPSPLSDPLGFVTHPLITPIILAAVTLNIPALALAQGALAGNLIITHLLTQQAQG